MDAAVATTERAGVGGRSDTSISLLSYSTLYPNAAMPQHGIFVEQRLHKLTADGSVNTTVVAPVPWFPSRNPHFGAYARYARAPKAEKRYGLSVVHPRYPAIPKVGMSAAPLLLAAATLPAVRAVAKGQGFDIIDAHYFYPDGVAAMVIGRHLGKPVVITARGTDINLIPEYTLPRRQILWAARHCARIITVSEALRARLLELGVNPAKVTTLRNGVDLAFFRPSMSRDALRSELGIHGFTLLSVGHLIERKGHDLVIRALAELPDVRLIIVGDGPLRRELAHLADQAGVAERVSWAGLRPQDELVRFYGAADALVLASSREGMANVLLESLACGTPVVATPLWGAPEVVTGPAAGVLTHDRSVSAILDAIRQLRSNLPDRAETRRHAKQYGWEPTTAGQLKIFSALTS